MDSAALHSRHMTAWSQISLWLSIPDQPPETYAIHRFLLENLLCIKSRDIKLNNFSNYFNTKKKKASLCIIIQLLVWRYCTLSLDKMWLGRMISVNILNHLKFIQIQNETSTVSFWRFVKRYLKPTWGNSAVQPHECVIWRYGQNIFFYLFTFLVSKNQFFIWQAQIRATAVTVKSVSIKHNTKTTCADPMLCVKELLSRLASLQTPKSFFPVLPCTVHVGSVISQPSASKQLNQVSSSVQGFSV